MERPGVQLHRFLAWERFQISRIAEQRISEIFDMENQPKIGIEDYPVVNGGSDSELGVPIFPRKNVFNGEPKLGIWGPRLR